MVPPNGICELKHVREAWVAVACVFVRGSCLKYDAAFHRRGLRLWP